MTFMLIEFSITNFLSFKEKNTFSMIASSDNTLEDNFVNVGNEKLLKMLADKWESSDPTSDEYYMYYKCMEAVGFRTPKKRLTNNVNGTMVHQCPTCRRRLKDNQSYRFCPKCGQEIWLDEDEVYEHDTEHEDQRRRVARLSLASRQARELVGISLRQCSLSHLAHGLDGLTGGIAVGHVGRDIDAGEHVEAVDVRGSVDTLHRAELVDGCHARRCAHIDIAQSLGPFAALDIALNHHAV